MSKIMLVNVTHVEESRVAVLEDGVLAAYEIETINRTQLKGNIYNAVVDNVHPTLEAAFLKLSPELKGFLPLDEVNFNLLPVREDSKRSGKIGRHLRAGQKIMAQVVREPFGDKPPTVSTYFSLPGRFLVLMPGVNTAGVSRKIEDPAQRERLKKIVEELRPPEGFGVIVRTAGLGQTKLELQRDMRYLLRLWQSVQRGSRASDFPGLVYREADLVIRTIRDHLSADISEVWIDSKETFDKALAFVRDVMPSRAKVLRLYKGDRLLFNKYNLEEQIESIYKRRVPLPSGGEIVIDGTEALTAIDVNSARSRRKGDAEETTLQTNLEAAAEIGRQLRLRDLGGLVVVDFIDMGPTRNKKKVEDAMKASLRTDRARHDMTRISKMGLIEIARQRVKAAKMGAMYNACPTCEGYGLIKTLEAAALAALRKLQTRSTRGGMGGIRLRLPPDVAAWMLDNKRDDLAQIERRQSIQVEIDPDPKMLRHEAELGILSRETVAAPKPRVVEDRKPPLPPAEKQIAEARPKPAAVETSDAVEKADAPASKPAPRRRRRRGRGGSASAPSDRDPKVRQEDDPKVVPFEPRPATESAGTATASTGTTTESTGPTTESTGPTAESTGPTAESAPAEGGEGRGRRRRRRRRRPRPAEASTDAAEKPVPPAAVQEDDEPVVPARVRSDELMPAAVGRSQTRRRSTTHSKSKPRGRGRRGGN